MKKTFCCSSPESFSSLQFDTSDFGVILSAGPYAFNVKLLFSHVNAWWLFDEEKRLLFILLRMSSELWIENSFLQFDISDFEALHNHMLLTWNSWSRTLTPGNFFGWRGHLCCSFFSESFQSKNKNYFQFDTSGFGINSSSKVARE